MNTLAVFGRWLHTLTVRQISIPDFLVCLSPLQQSSLVCLEGLQLVPKCSVTLPLSFGLSVITVKNDASADGDAMTTARGDLILRFEISEEAVSCHPLSLSSRSPHNLTPKSPKKSEGLAGIVV